MTSAGEVVVPGQAGLLVFVPVPKYAAGTSETRVVPREGPQ